MMDIDELVKQWADGYREYVIDTILEHVKAYPIEGLLDYATFLRHDWMHKDRTAFAACLAARLVL